MKRLAITLGLTALWTSALLGCDPKPGETPNNLTELNVALIDRTYSPKTVKVAPGSNLRIFLDNVAQTEGCFQNKDLNVDVTVDPGERETIDWKAPDQLGTYEFRCDATSNQTSDDAFKLVVEKPIDPE